MLSVVSDNQISIAVNDTARRIKGSPIIDLSRCCRSLPMIILCSLGNVTSYA